MWIVSQRLNNERCLCICWSRASVLSSSQDWNKGTRSLNLPVLHSPHRDHQRKGSGCICWRGTLFSQSENLGCCLLEVYGVVTWSGVVISHVWCGYGPGIWQTASPNIVVSSVAVQCGPKLSESTSPCSAALKLGIPVCSFKLQCTRIGESNTKMKIPALFLRLVYTCGESWVCM